LNIADIAKEAFDAVAAEISGVIKVATLKRESVAAGNYDTDTGVVQTTEAQLDCRLVFAGAGAGQKYMPDVTITPPDEVVFLEGLASMPPKQGDVLLVEGARWQLAHPPRDIAGGAGLWVAVVRAA
jgi:hypothetical protein